MACRKPMKVIFVIYHNITTMIFYLFSSLEYAIVGTLVAGSRYLSSRNLQEGYIIKARRRAYSNRNLIWMRLFAFHSALIPLGKA